MLTISSSAYIMLFGSQKNIQQHKQRRLVDLNHLSALSSRLALLVVWVVGVYGCGGALATTTEGGGVAASIGPGMGALAGGVADRQ